MITGVFIQKVKQFVAKLGASTNRDSTWDERRRRTGVDRDIENEKPTNQKQDKECAKENVMSITASFCTTS